VAGDAGARAPARRARPLPLGGGAPAAERHRFAAARRVRDVALPRRSAVVRILWQDEKGKAVPLDETWDREFLKKGSVFSDDQIDSYIDLKMEENMRTEMTPHPVEYDMYYSC